MKDMRPSDVSSPKEEKPRRIRHGIRWMLVGYDVLIFLFVSLLFLLAFPSLGLGPTELPDPLSFLAQILLGVLLFFSARVLAKVYSQIWRYGDTHTYLRLIFADAVATVAFGIAQPILSILQIQFLNFLQVLSIACVNLLFAIAMRMTYQYVFFHCRTDDRFGRFLRTLLRIFAGIRVKADSGTQVEEGKIPLAIVGAGRVGVELMKDISNHPRTPYVPVCFVDVNDEKAGRQINGVRVFFPQEATPERLCDLGVKEIVFALPPMSGEKKRELYEKYEKTGCPIKVYDYPLLQSAEKSGRRQMREFAIEELLFRDPILVADTSAAAYYRHKVVMITGGGGSIGSELCRQIAKMEPKRLIIADICENGAYEIQQELKMQYGSDLDMVVKILSVSDEKGFARVFQELRPQVLLHAAAHKHVPLMENNCCEAVKNNVFGTATTVALAERYGVERFILISTDKAVNPTNIMGATKRMCEMILQGHSQSGSGTVYSAVRFGNVLGSAGSVIPLFKRQIAKGGPITLTDRRIIRYFMTIPEASNLVLQAGAMAKQGELFVLDMGKPIQILKLAENLIRLSGYEPYTDIDIVETGLRPGEKLYEELLVRHDDLEKTENSLIFIERESPLSMQALSEKLSLLRDALETENDLSVKAAMMTAVPTFRAPEFVNATAETSQEMQMAKV